MKRYDMCAISGHVEEIEHPLGFWIKWEDHKKELIVDKMNSIAIIEDLVDTITRLKYGEVCNCKEKMTVPVDGMKWEDISPWICPAHGYKKR